MTSSSSLAAFLACAAGPLLGACAESSAPPAGHRFSINVAALSLTGVQNAAYRIEVRNASGDVVFDADVTADQHGDGAGSVSYVGVCDASGTGMNTVSLVLRDLYAGNGTTSPIGHDDYVNPCGFEGLAGTDDDINWDGFACTKTVQCLPNADVPVQFDLVLARRAQQGFFDVAVTFSDIFCSAKVDCQQALLLDAQGTRGPTAVVAFACTAGPGQDTTLYMNDIVVECAGDPVTRYYTDPSRGPGNTGASPIFFQTAEYFGREQLPQLAKCYWNSALGLDLDALPAGCTLHARATASERPFTNNTTPANTSYPVIAFDVPLTSATGELVCDDAAHPLNGGNGVATTYGAVAGERFTHAMACDDDPQPVDEGRLLCGATGPAGDAVVFTETNDGVVVQVGSGTPSAAYDLPNGLHLETCCGNPCCADGGPR